MVELQDVEQQLQQTGHIIRFWGRSEFRELCRVLAPGEVVTEFVNGYYLGGFAMLAATNRRLLLVDSKPMFLTIEAIWYDKISQVDYNHRLVTATISIFTFNKILNFLSFNNGRLREVLIHIQEEMAKIRAEQEQSQYQYQAVPGINSQIPVPKPANTALSNIASLPMSSLGKDSSPQLFASDNTTLSLSRLPFTRRRYFSKHA